MVFEVGPSGGDWLMRVEPSGTGFSTLRKETPSATWEHSERTVAYAPESGLSPDTESAVALISDFQPRKLGEVNVCRVSPQVYGTFVLVAPMGLDRDTLKRTKGRSLKAVYFESIRFSKTSVVIHFIRPPRVWACNSYESQDDPFPFSTEHTDIYCTFKWLPWRRCPDLARWSVAFYVLAAQVRNSACVQLKSILQVAPCLFTDIGVSMRSLCENMVPRETVLLHPNSLKIGSCWAVSCFSI